MAPELYEELQAATYRAALATLGVGGSNQTIAERHPTAHPGDQCDCPMEVLLAMAETAQDASISLARAPWWALEDLSYAVVGARLPRGFTPDMVDPRFTAFHISGMLMQRVSQIHIKAAAPLFDGLDGLAWVFERGHDTSARYEARLSEAGVGRFPMHTYQGGLGWEPFGRLIPTEVADVIHRRWPRTRVPGRKRQRAVISAALGCLPSTFQS